MKVVFDNLANFLSISPNQTPVFAVCLSSPSWTFLPFLFLLILYSLPYMYTLYNGQVPTPTCTVQYVISSAVNIRLQLYTCFLTMRSKHASSKILNDIGRKSLLGNRKKIAKFLMRTFTCRSTFLYAYNVLIIFVHNKKSSKKMTFRTVLTHSCPLFCTHLKFCNLRINILSLEICDCGLA